MMELAPLSWPASWHYAFGKPQQRATFKQQWQDFQVVENLGFEPSGEGEHVMLDITKVDTNTEYLARQLAKLAQVNNREVAYSGLKDRHGVTRQWFAVHLPGKGDNDPDWQALASEKVHIHQVIRHQKKLRSGVHVSNSFVITLRDMANHAATNERLAQIAAQGVPNYFAEQRFGHQGKNLELAQKLLTGGRIKDRFKRSMALSAGRAYVFNELLSARVANGTWRQACDGDFYAFADGYSQFAASADELTQARIEAGEIVPLGWLAGRSGRAASSQASAMEQHLLAHMQPWVDGLARQGLDGDRRPLVLKPMDWQWRWKSGSLPAEGSSPADGSLPADGSMLELSFSLLRGAYATSVLRELVQTHNPHQQDG